MGDEDVAGQGMFYCESCCRFFASSAVLEEHEGSKAHKKEVKKRKWDDAMEAKEAALVDEYKRNRRCMPATAAGAAASAAATAAAVHSTPATEAQTQETSETSFQSLTTS